MDSAQFLNRYLQTRRRRITPIKRKHRKTVPKTRGHKVEKKPYVPLRKHTSSQQHERRDPADSHEHSENSEREGNQDSNLEGGREDKEEYTQIEQGRTTENPEESVHPGPLQALPEMYKCADDTQTSETSIEAEELP
jgi:hypothetical protein